MLSLYLGLRLPASSTARNKFPLFNPPSLESFIMAVQSNTSIESNKWNVLTLMSVLFHT